MDGLATVAAHVPYEPAVASGGRAIASPVHGFTGSVGGIANGFMVETLGYVLGGGVGLWLATHAGMTAAALTLALLCLACAWQMLLLRTLRVVARPPIAATIKQIGGDVLTLVNTRRGL